MSSVLQSHCRLSECRFAFMSAVFEQSSSSRASRKVNNRGGGVHTVGKSGGERVDAVCDDQACN